MLKRSRLNNYSTPSFQSTPTLFEQLRFFAPSYVTERERDVNESDIKKLQSCVAAAAAVGIIKQPINSGKGKKEPVAECWCSITDDEQG